jgi:long-chain acyl-CoA synthetase
MEEEGMQQKLITVGSIYKKRFVAEKTAILFKGEEISYAEVDDQVIAYANYLKQIGVRPGTKVMLDMGNCPAFLYTYLGTTRNAAVIVPVNAMLTLNELVYIAKDSDAEYLMISEEVLASHKFTTEKLAAELGVRVIVSDDALAAEIATAPREDYDLAADEETISTYLYTSGTTGSPKAAMLSHRNLAGNAGQVEEFWNFSASDLVMCVLPMFHVFAFTLCILSPLRSGGTISIIESFAPKTVIAEILEKEITVFMGVPAMLMVITEIMKKDNIRFPKLRLAAYGGASTPLQLFNTMVELGIPPAEGFGLTEGSPAVLLNPLGKARALSCGVPITDVACRIVDENGNDVPVGEVGELIARGPNIMKGYYNRPEETEIALHGGWLHTGDLAKKDEDDYYYIVDRIKDMAIVSGLNVYPREIEEVLYKHPEIRDAAVIGVPDKLRGEVTIAYIVLKDPSKTVHHKEILRYLREYLATYKIPRRIVVIDDLPRNSTGKILKRMLKEQEPSEEE